MLRIVLDTNIAISGLIWRGPPHQLLVALAEDKFTAHTSYALVSELPRKLLGSKLGAELLETRYFGPATGHELRRVV